ncbi:MAG: SDR family NAD(P)-dependent oxidoreductase [Alphaproteobacteria bacterium]
MVDYAVKDRTALITGGARGIGFATATILAREGARLALVDIDGDAATEAAKRLNAETGAQTVGIRTDITDLAEVRRMAEEAETALGPVDILVNSAAIVDNKTFLESNEADWKRVIDVLLYGPIHTTHTLLPGMCERGWGRVVCLASDAGRTGQARLSVYGAAKAGVIALVKSVAQEVGRAGVTLNVISPGATNTEMRQAREDDMRQQMGDEKYAKRLKTVLRMYPTGRIGEPEDVASAVAFLCSAQASWITGQVLSVNGGFAMP